MSFINMLKEAVRLSLVVPSFEGQAPEAKFNDWFDGRFSRDLSQLFALVTEIFVFNYGDPMVWVGKAMTLGTQHGLIKPSAPSSAETKN